MGLPNFATRTGDGGETSLWSGERVSKTDLRIAANAEIDFALSALGRGHGWLGQFRDRLPGDLAERLLHLQRRFVALMGEVATSGDRQEAYRERREAITEADLAAVDALYADLHARASARRPKLDRWQLYGEKGAAAAEFYFIRAAFRRAELALWRVAEAGHPVRTLLCQVLNRCGDLFFVLALLLEEENSGTVGLG